MGDQVGVSLGHRQGFMSHQFFYGQDGGHLDGKPGGKSMPEGVKGDLLPAIFYLGIESQAPNHPLEGLGNKSDLPPCSP